MLLRLGVKTRKQDSSKAHSSGVAVLPSVAKEPHGSPAPGSLPTTGPATEPAHGMSSEVHTGGTGTIGPLGSIVPLPSSVRGTMWLPYAMRMATKCDRESLMLGAALEQNSQWFWQRNENYPEDASAQNERLREEFCGIPDKKLPC